MQVQLLVERDQNECIVNLAGTAYKFEWNEYGHLVSEITDLEHIKWVSDPHNSAFKLYNPPKTKVIEETVHDTVESRMSAHFGNEIPVHEQVGKDAYAPHVGQVDASEEPDLPPYPQKGSKRPTKRKS